MPDYDILKPFSCLCFFSTLTRNRSKFDPGGAKGIFLGFAEGVKGYRVLDLEDQTISITRNIEFHECLFPFLDKAEDQIDETPSAIIQPVPNDSAAKRRHNQPKYLQDYHCYLASNNNADAYEGNKSIPCHLFYHIID